MSSNILTSRERLKQTVHKILKVPIILCACTEWGGVCRTGHAEVRGQLGGVSPFSLRTFPWTLGAGLTQRHWRPEHLQHEHKWRLQQKMHTRHSTMRTDGNKIAIIKTMPGGTVSLLLPESSSPRSDQLSLSMLSSMLIEIFFNNSFHIRQI